MAQFTMVSFLLLNCKIQSKNNKQKKDEIYQSEKNLRPLIATRID